MDYKDLTPEEIARTRNMSVDELQKFVADKGVELSEEELDKVSGGWSDDDKDENCPKGDRHSWKDIGGVPVLNVVIPFKRCRKCGLERRA
ncbi:MAG: hypothetical protein IKG21_00445 [Atopobiaceae bacterium]|nr:hypothetical protein [Atopobiaceae bacterium]